MNKILNKENINVVMYHCNCADGFGSAFVVWNYYKSKYGVDRANEIEYISCNYLKSGEKISDYILNKVKGKNVVMCDFSYKYDELMVLINLSNQFLILDHHKTAQADLNNISSDNKVFNMDKSGVGITWEFFHGDDQLPYFLSLIQDRDLWNFSNLDTDNFSTYLFEQEYSFEVWEKFMQKETIEEAVRIGTMWTKYKDITINNLVNSVSYMIFRFNSRPIIIGYVNSPIFKSEIGNRIFNKIPFADFSVVWDYDMYKDLTKFSLRSTDDRQDVSVVAKMFGGGGHRNASGVIMKGLQCGLGFELAGDRDSDLKLLALLKNKSVQTCFDTQYCLYECEQIYKQWTDDEYLDLILRKNQEAKFVIFKVKSNLVSITPDMNSVSCTYDYYFIHNTYHKSPVTNLSQAAMGTRHYFLQINSDKEFDELAKVIFGSQTK